MMIIGALIIKKDTKMELGLKYQKTQILVMNY